MIRLNMVVEGQTEEQFVRHLLAPHLEGFQVFATARLIATRRSRLKTYKGGLPGYGKAREDIVRWLKQDTREDAHFTTMFDLYGLSDDFPGYDEAQMERNPRKRVELLESNLGFDIGVGPQRFTPYIQLHEFEALLVADIGKVACCYPGKQTAILALLEEVRAFPYPEDVDDGEETSPSKRIQRHIEGYSKVMAGAVTAIEIGLPTLRAKCPHFNDWVTKLESLGKTGSA